MFMPGNSNAITVTTDGQLHLYTVSSLGGVQKEVTFSNYLPVINIVIGVPLRPLSVK